MSPQDVLVALRQAFTGGDSVGRLVLAGALLIVVVAVTLVVLWLVQVRSPKGRVEALLDERAATANASRWPWRIATLLFVLGLVLGVEFYAGRPSQCAQCHRGASYAEALEESAHEGVGCLSCHRQGGPVAGRVGQAASYTRWILVYTSSKKPPEPSPGSVGDGACLRCHYDVRSGTASANGIKVRHSDFLAAGLHCRECHNSSAHEVIEASEPSMAKCLPCHDGETASAECSTCHEKDVAEVRKDTRGMSKARVDTGNCYGCHDKKPCTACHGVTMPHPKDWLPNPAGPGVSGTHAREAFVNRESCWRCHDAEEKPFAPNPAFCNCHGRPFGKMHGGEAWVQEHSLQATGKKGGVASECFMCHTGEMCENCHPASYTELYAPRIGPDDYRRDPEFPYDPDWFEW